MSDSPPGDEVPPAEVARGVREDGWLIVDVRTPDELQSDGRFPGARHVSMDSLNEQAETIPRDRTVIFACRTGSRSGMAAEAFRMAGWDAHNLAGGIDAWEAAGLEVERGEAGEAPPDEEAPPGETGSG